MTTTIQKWGNSHGIKIPKIIMEHLNIRENDEIGLQIENEAIVLKKLNKYKTIEELFEGYEEKYIPIKIDWGEPVGREIW